eukprot:2038841-Rhodomonas_salina.2
MPLCDFAISRLGFALSMTEAALARGASGGRTPVSCYALSTRCPGMALPGRAAAGSQVRYQPTRAMRCPVLIMTLSVYARAMRCPVLR